ncbi:bacillithiol biosynthesis deacetylase BshB1 [Reichenbachiella agariperforans]|uniref:Bacillithiol biosynthesis deacetylase BshB1 n=1 Tax=Reichenbachiella agariperforans TaxID=156994 RepID=A0A1M6T1I8_REIAG|nr:bacillithiol biosynthesis deacetylase BshB1 [Reichenbachiella agariperforans]MBU2914804.1 bacillithiol biosynthesis deacetylase BshB1 [Reichenbachiella agariperforans]SHK50790.1 bacillithiol biosynthesis deacetylase BshB1 [Reichenbachiella agariperforans]
MKLDVLAFAAHPDDIELSCGGTLLSLAAQGKKTGIVDFTRGEMGTRGTPEIRDQEAAAAAQILHLTARENLGFKDVYFENNDAHVLEVVKMIRKYQPSIILANSISDRHPDHGKAAAIVKKALFIAGLKKVETILEGETQEIWRADNLYHYIQTDYHHPDFVVDVSDYWTKRMEAVRAYQSQFFNPSAGASNTLISSPEFMELLEARAREYGMAIRVKYGEGFVKDRMLGVSDLTSLR